ncbi:hypothetical protein AALA00_11365 [Lachnospiraceae bacterium 46-15]
MKINGVDISTYNAKQIKVTPGKRTITNESETIGGYGVEIMLAPEFGIKTYEIMLVVYGNNREEIWENVDRIVNLLRNPSDVKLDGFKHNFRLALSAVRQEEHGPALSRWHTVTLECKGYEFGEVKEFSVESPVFEFHRMTYPDKDTRIQEFDMGGILENLGDGNIVPVPLGIKIEQTYKENEIPHIIFGDIEIHGVCMGRRGKDMGSIVIKPRSFETVVEIQGSTGKVKSHLQSGEISTGDLGVYMPCVPVCGFEVQPVKIVTSLYAGGGSTLAPWVLYKQLKYTFSYTRVFI